MTATERPSLEARARKWLYTFQDHPLDDLIQMLESVQSEERALADTRLQTAVTTMEQATQAMLEAQAEVVELRAALAKAGQFASDREWMSRDGDPTSLESERVVRACVADEIIMLWQTALARPQPEAILRVLRAAVVLCAPYEMVKRFPWEFYGDAEDHNGKMTTIMDAVRALPEGVREVLK